jgi:hypothetical protein
MKTAWKSRLIGVTVVVLCASLVTGAQSEGWRGGGLGSGLGKGWVQLHGRILCASCTLETLPVQHQRLYQLEHRLGRVLIEANSEQSPFPYHRFWLKSDDQVFATLAAEENLFKEVEVSGLLREYLPTAGTLDLAVVTVMSK